MAEPLLNEAESETAKTTPAEEGADAPASRSTIRTLHSDVAASVRDNNTSITAIALAQQKKNAELPFVDEEESPGWQIWSGWSIGTIALVLAGFGVLAVSAFILISKNVSMPFLDSEPFAPTLVPVESQQTIDATRVTRADFVRNITTFVASNYLSPVTLEALIIKESVSATTSEGELITTVVPMNIERFFERIGSNAPGRLVRSIGPDMTFGRAGETPFLITTTPSYESAFAGMLEWEPLMAEDLSFITKQLPTPTATETSTASTTETASTTNGTSTEATTTPPVVIDQPIPEPVWKDIIVRNKDVRALIAHDDTILLLYAFPEEGLLVITQTKDALILIVNALSAPVFGV